MKDNTKGLISVIGILIGIVVIALIGGLLISNQIDFNFDSPAIVIGGAILIVLAFSLPGFYFSNQASSDGDTRRRSPNSKSNTTEQPSNIRMSL